MELIKPHTVLLDKYRVEHPIGHGGMGNVYAATHLAMDRQVAIKVLRSELSGDPDLVERFSREVIATARVNNPYVVSVYDVDRLTDGTLFIVMDLLRGETLRERMQRHPVPHEECVDILVEAAAALTAAHQASVVHRDLKPENIFVTADPLQVKVVDFGIAKLEDAETITVTNALMGTPAYMAPEQLISLRNTGPRSDLWSLGVVAFELFTGRTPFHADSMPGLCAAILTGEPLKLDDLPEMNTDLRAAVLRCLERQPENRYQSAAAFARAIASQGSARSQRALAVLDQTTIAVDATQPIQTSNAPPRGEGHASGRPPVQAQPSVRAAVQQNAKNRRWAWVGAAAMLALGVGSWSLHETIPQQAVLNAAAASLSWLSNQASEGLQGKPHSAPLHEPSTRFQVEEPGQAIHLVSFSVDGKVITSFSAESGRVRLWNPSSKTELRTLPAEGVERAYVGANGYALTKTAQGVLTQWSLLSGVSVGTAKLESAIAFAGSMDLGVVVVTADRQLITMSELGHKTDSIALPLDASGVLAVRSDRRKAIVGTVSSTFLFVDLPREQVAKLESPYDSALSSAMFLSQKQGVITGDNEGHSMVWLPPGQLPVHELPRLNGPVLTISASADGQQVLLASPHQLLLYEPESRHTKLLSPAGVAISTARLSSDGTQVAVGNDQGEVLMFASSDFE